MIVTCPQQVLRREGRWDGTPSIWDPWEAKLRKGKETSQVEWRQTSSCHTILRVPSGELVGGGGIIELSRPFIACLEFLDNCKKKKSCFVIVFCSICVLSKMDVLEVISDTVAFDTT